MENYVTNERRERALNLEFISVFFEYVIYIDEKIK